MSNDIQSLLAIPERASIAGKGFRINPLSPRVVGGVNKFFRTAENQNGWQLAIDKIFKEGDVDTSAQFIYLCLDHDHLPGGVVDMESFCKLLLDDNKDLGLVSELLTKCLNEGGADYEVEAIAPKKKLLQGLILLSLAMIGLIYSVYWLTGLILPLMDSLTLV